MLHPYEIPACALNFSERALVNPQKNYLCTQAHTLIRLTHYQMPLTVMAELYNWREKSRQLVQSKYLLANSLDQNEQSVIWLISTVSLCMSLCNLSGEDPSQETVCARA